VYPWTVVNQGQGVLTLAWPKGIQDGTTLTSSDQAGALPLPDQSQVTVFGTLDLQHGQRVYQIPQDPRTHDLGIEVTSATPGSLLTIAEIALFDATGRKIADTTSGPEPGVLSMDVGLVRMNRFSGIYLKIAAAPSALASAATESGSVSDNFVLQVTQNPQPASGPSPASGPQGAPPALAGVEPSSLAPRPVSHDELLSGLGETPLPLSTWEEGIASPGLPPVGSSATALAGQALPLVVTGPLPERAGGPLGGFLTEGDPVPQLDRHDPALIDLALIGLAEPLPGADDADLAAVLADLGIEIEPRSGVPASGSTSTSTSTSLVTLRGPGGFPLQTASIYGDPAPDLDSLVAVLPPTAATTALIAPAVVTPKTTAAENVNRPVRTRLTMTALSGLAMALSTGFHLVLPDFNALLTKLERPRFRVRLRLRLRLRRKV
jgi:hypothetical protein